jgi:hypothetical protein
LARIGVFSTLIIVFFGFVVPFFIFKLCRWIDFRLFLGLTFLIGLLYGALKAEYPWSGNGILGNAALMAASGLVLAAYVALSYGGASLVGRAASSLRR